ncbi:hypothetical protein D3C78_1718060 [compost metagenome]
MRVVVPITTVPLNAPHTYEFPSLSAITAFPLSSPAPPSPSPHKIFGACDSAEKEMKNESNKSKYGSERIITNKLLTNSKI